ncbi:NUDIX domain-containing protein [Kitasatospora sp. NPDC057198]|uniref:NUDIX domain-containing protein n=1 Tax=Kitasatospora sp. NPDC057198 TaxID=3346046 RepID=UPI00362A17D2
MPVTRPEIAAAVRAHLEHHPGERARLRPLLDPAAPPAHVTCGAVVLGHGHDVLRVRGAAADPDPLAGAIRAVEAATGIKAAELCLVPPFLDRPAAIEPLGAEPPGGGYEFHYVLRLAAPPPPAPARGEWRPLAELPASGLRDALLAAGAGVGPDGRPEPVNASALVHDGHGRYLLHLRDNVPHIWAPGEFSLLGGGREPGDATIEATLRRELAEEAPGIRLGEVEPLTVEWTTDRHGLAVPIRIFTTRWQGHPDAADLREGVLLHWFRPEELHRIVLRDSTRQLIREHAAGRAG